MADDSNRMSVSRVASGVTSGTPALRPASGATSVGSADSGSVAPFSGGGSAARSGLGAPRGSRMLPADYPVDQLDRNAARGTYLDILV
ncbi:MAG: hypothetical protein NVV74_22910 [Magnetospirillum sp.]|nr:hypothetical protein [Magnetospirillum sp.]